MNKENYSNVENSSDSDEPDSDSSIIFQPRKKKRKKKTTVYFYETCTRKPFLHLEECFKTYHTLAKYK